MNLLCFVTDQKNDEEGLASQYADDMSSQAEASSDSPSHLQTSPEPEPTQQVNANVRSALKKWKTIRDEQSLDEQNDELEEVLLDNKQSVRFERGVPSRHSKGKKGSQPDKIDNTVQSRHRLRSLFLGEGEQHRVFQPSQHKQTNSPHTHFSNVVANVMARQQQQRKQSRSHVPTTPFLPHQQTLKERREDFDTVIKATQIVLKEQIVDLIQTEELDSKSPKSTLKSITQRVTKEIAKSKQQKSPKLYGIVDLAMREKACLGSANPEDAGHVAEDIEAIHWPTRTSDVLTPTVVPVSIQKWRKLVQKKTSCSSGMSQQPSHPELDMQSASMAKNCPKSADYNESQSSTAENGLHNTRVSVVSPCVHNQDALAKSQDSPTLRQDIGKSTPELATITVPGQVSSHFKEQKKVSAGDSETKAQMQSAPTLSTNSQ